MACHPLGNCHANPLLEDSPAGQRRMGIGGIDPDVLFYKSGGLDSRSHLAFLALPSVGVGRYLTTLGADNTDVGWEFF